MKDQPLQHVTRDSLEPAPAHPGRRGPDHDPPVGTQQARIDGGTQAGGWASPEGPGRTLAGRYGSLDGGPAGRQEGLD